MHRSHWIPLFVAGSLALLGAGCGEQSPTAGMENASAAHPTAEAAGDSHAGHNHAEGEHPGEEKHVEAGKPDPSGAPGKGPWAKIDLKKYMKTPTGLTYAVIKEGKGTAISNGQGAVMHYTGWLQKNGKKFDSSRDRNQPFPFSLGGHEVIAGWDEGVLGMKVGEQRQLVIPAALAYGEGGRPGIPGGATLVFDVELMGIR